MESGAGATTRAVTKAVTLGVVLAIAIVALTTSTAFAAKKLKACTLVPQTQLESAVGNPFDTPEDTTVGPVEASCRFPARDVTGDDLNLFLTTDVKGGVKGAIAGNFFATKKSFQKVYGSATPVPGIGKQAFTAFDGSSSVAQGSLLVLDGKNHAVLIVLTGDGVTADTTVAKGKAVAAAVLRKLK